MNSQTFSRVLFSLLIAPLFSACVQVMDEPSEESSDPQAAHQAPQINEYEVIAGEPNQYKVLLSIPEGVQVVQRENETTRNRATLVLQMENGKLVDSSPEPGSTQTYYMGVVQSGVFQIVKTVQVKIPQDLVLNGNITLSSNTFWSNVNRIILQRGLVLTTNGFHLQIEAQEMQSAGAIIQTFPANLRADRGNRGRDGGKVEIRVQDAKGNLHFQMRGESGGHAVIGINGGNGGDSGWFSLVVENESSLKVERLNQEGHGGAGARAGTSYAAPGINGKKEPSCYETPSVSDCY